MHLIYVHVIVSRRSQSTTPLTTSTSLHPRFIAFQIGTTMMDFPEAPQLGGYQSCWTKVVEGLGNFRIFGPAQLPELPEHPESGRFPEREETNLKQVWNDIDITRQYSTSQNITREMNRYSWFAWDSHNAESWAHKLVCTKEPSWFPQKCSFHQLPHHCWWNPHSM